MGVAPPGLNLVVGQEREEVFFLIGLEFVECTDIESIVNDNLRHILLAVRPRAVARIGGSIETDVVLRKPVGLPLHPLREGEEKQQYP